MRRMYIDAELIINAAGLLATLDALAGAVIAVIIGTAIIGASAFFTACLNWSRNLRIRKKGRKRQWETALS